MAGERFAVFDSDFLADLAFWIKTDRKMASRLLDLVGAVMRDPFQGIGKPEPLRHTLTGCWSRRLNQEHRMVYRVKQDRVEFLFARYHYD
jgi:toxin YoeB